MTVIFKSNVEYCLSDHLNHWLNCFVAVSESTSCDDSPHNTYTLQLWANESDYENCSDSGTRGTHSSAIDLAIFSLDVVHDVDDDGGDDKTRPRAQAVLFEIVFKNNNCTIGRRDVGCFMKGSLLEEVLTDFPEDLYYIATTDATINFRGADAAHLALQLQYRRCTKLSEVHNYELDKIYYVCTDIGEVDVDETEFLLSVTPTDVAVISLHRCIITRLIPITKIRKFSTPRGHDSVVKVEVGRIKHGNRSYLFRSNNAPAILDSLRQQIKLISAQINKNVKKELDREMQPDSPKVSWSSPSTSRTSDELVVSFHLPEYQSNVIYETTQIMSEEMNFIASPEIYPHVKPLRRQQSVEQQGTEFGEFEEKFYYSSDESSGDYSYAKRDEMHTEDSIEELEYERPLGDEDESSILETCSNSEVAYESIDHFYEKVSFQLNSVHQAGSIQSSKRRKSRLRKIRIHKIPHESTFVSHIIGGVDTLKHFRGRFENESVVRTDTSGEYAMLHDPKYKTDCKKEDNSQYDVLCRK